MKSIRTLATALLTLGAVAAHALVLFLDAPILDASTGDVVTYTGTLLNDATTDLFVSTDSITLDILDPLDWDGLTIDDVFLTGFLTQYPALMPAGATYAGPLFSVAVGPTATSRTNSGNFALLDDQGAILADQNFALNVTQVVPEPSALVALATPLLLFARRRR